MSMTLRLIKYHVLAKHNTQHAQHYDQGSSRGKVRGYMIQSHVSSISEIVCEVSTSLPYMSLPLGPCLMERRERMKTRKYLLLRDKL